MASKAATVAQYLAELEPDRRKVVRAVRRVILDNLGPGYREGMQYGMIGYFVPHSVYPPGYHCDPKQPLPFACLAAQKNSYSLHLMCLYSSPSHQAWFRNAWTGAGKKLDMGKACVRFKKLDDVPLEVLAEAIRRVPVEETIAVYEQGLRTSGKPVPTGDRHGSGKDGPKATARKRGTKAAEPRKKAEFKNAPGKSDTSRSRPPKRSPKRKAASR